MSHKPLSLYTIAFNIIDCQFNLESAIKNYIKVADEVVIATIPEDKMKDNTLSELLAVSEKYPQLKIVILDIDPDKDAFWDGKLKTTALNNCSHDYCIKCDLDERLGGDREVWQQAVNFLESNPPYQSLMLPVVNIHTSAEYYKDISQKWYLHRREGTKCGPVNFAKRQDGTIDTDKSDGAELIDLNGNLTNALRLNIFNEAQIIHYIQNGGAYIAHFGYLDLERKASVNRKFLKSAWDRLNGSDVENVILNSKEMESNVFKHNILDLPEY